MSPCIQLPPTLYRAAQLLSLNLSRPSDVLLAGLADQTNPVNRWQPGPHSHGCNWHDTCGCQQYAIDLFDAEISRALNEDWPEEVALRA